MKETSKLTVLSSKNTNSDKLEKKEQSPIELVIMKEKTGWKNVDNKKVCRENIRDNNLLRQDHNTRSHSQLVLSGWDDRIFPCEPVKIFDFAKFSRPLTKKVRGNAEKKCLDIY